MTKLTLTATAWRPLQKNTLQGFATIHVAELGMSFLDVAIHAKHDKAWAAPPSRPWVNGDADVKGDDGKVQYSPILEFANKETRDAFSSAAIRAVRDRYPDALSIEGER